MTQLPLNDSIQRFKDNDERVDIFVNGNATSSYTSSNSEIVPSIQKFLADEAVVINAYVTNVYSSVISARDEATAAASNAAASSATATAASISAANSATIAVNAMNAALNVSINTADFATAAQGVKADTALQPNNVGSIAVQNAANVAITGGSINGISSNNITINTGSAVTFGANTLSANSGNIGNFVSNSANVNILRVNFSGIFANGASVANGTFNVSSTASFTNTVSFSSNASMNVANFKLSGGNTTFKWLTTDGSGNLSFGRPAIADLSDGQSTVDTINGNIIALTIALG